MQPDTPARRDVLTAIGAGGLTAPVGSTTAAGSDRSVRVVEVYRTYDLPDGEPYDRYHWDSLPPYVVDDGTIRPVGQESLPGKGGVNAPDGSVGVDEIRKQRLGGDETSSLTTRTAPRGRTAETVSLAEPLTQPTFEVAVDADRTSVDHQNGRSVAGRGDDTEFTVDVGTVTVETKRTLDERVDDPAIPPAERALKTVRGTTDVFVQMSVVVRDLGELRVGPPRR